MVTTRYLTNYRSPHRRGFAPNACGRCLLACKAAVDSAGPNHKISKEVSATLSGEEMKDIRKRYKKALEGLGLLDSNDGWKFFKQNGSGTKVYSKYDDKGNLWIKVDGIFRGTPTSCASVWKVRTDGRMDGWTDGRMDNGSFMDNWFIYGQLVHLPRCRLDIYSTH
jgi:hypothetical protein